MPDTFPEPHAEFVKETKVVPGICSRCGGSTTGQDVMQGTHRYFPDCFVVMKAENERLTKLAAEALQVRDAARERSTADLEAKRNETARASLCMDTSIKLRGVLIDIRSFFGKDEDHDYKLVKSLTPELRDRLISAIGDGIQ